MRKLITLALVLVMATSSIFAQQPIKKTVYILATGGTIAGSGESSVGSQYKAGQASIAQLLNAVPQIEDIADIRGEQVVNIGSQDMTDEVMLTVAKRVNELLAKESVAGVVITHGTDTMEESAYFLSLTVNSKKPVVLVGSMRPSTAMSADGNRNLYNAVVVAAAEVSNGCGVVVAMNDKIFDAKSVTKTNTMSVETFASPNSGAIGYINNGKVIFTQIPMSAFEKAAFDISKTVALPSVAILYGHSSPDRVLVDVLIEKHYNGIVYAGVGNGNIHKNIFPALQEAVKKETTVVRSSRVPSGAVTEDAEIDDSKYGFIASHQLNPQKSRILLMLCLAAGYRTEEIREMFRK